MKELNSLSSRTPARSPVCYSMWEDVIRLADSPQQMYAINQEQLLQLEYLAKQIFLKHNKQQAKEDEQLDVIAREMERKIKRFANNKVS